MNILSPAGLQDSGAMKDGSYNDALSRFNAQTEELKRLLADEGEVVSASDGETDEETGEDSSSEEEDSSDQDSSDDDSDDSDWDSDLDYLEAVLQGGAPPDTLIKKPIAKTNSSPALLAMDASMQNADENVLPGILDLKERMRRTSASYLQSPVYMTETKPETVENPFASTRPDDHLKSILEGFSAASFPSETWHDYFLKMTDEHVEAHTTEVEQAIRNRDYTKMRDMLRQGHTLQTCNKHGESIVHIACRRGTLELVQFLIQEAGLTTQIRDDMGRTPLHDACCKSIRLFRRVCLLRAGSLLD